MSKEWYDNMHRNDPTRWDGDHPFDKNIKFLIHTISKVKLKIIDLGCGNGRTLDFIYWDEHWELHGIDYSPEAVRLAKIKLGYRANIIQGDMTHTPYDDGYFDFVISVGSFEHQEVLNFSEPRRLVKSSGCFLCVLPDVKESKGLTVAVDGQHYDWELTKEDWITKIEPFGFKFIQYLEPWTFVFQSI